MCKEQLGDELPYDKGDVGNEYPNNEIATVCNICDVNTNATQVYISVGRLIQNGHASM
jgi:hypothetical protein